VNQQEALHRISAENFLLAQKALETAAVLIDLGYSIGAQTQRQAFASLRPLIHDLRKKGHSWKKITHYLNQSGFDIKTATVRSYFASLETHNTR
jgi:hypothetical protein